ncbi:MAG: glycoside hydrolase family 5 protein [Lachnospiraceae bacterium]|nr:glycoside hydrolase family 5 protein [Lachnospiraceae bacterium]
MKKRKNEHGLSEADGNGEIDKASANKWFKLLNKYNISYFCWSLSNKEESSSLLQSGTAKTSAWKTSDLSAAGKYIRKKYLARVEKLGNSA